MWIELIYRSFDPMFPCAMGKCFLHLFLLVGACLTLLVSSCTLRFIAATCKVAEKSCVWEFEILWRLSTGCSAWFYANWDCANNFFLSKTVYMRKTAYRHYRCLFSQAKRPLFNLTRKNFRFDKWRVQQRWDLLFQKQ